MIWMFSGGVYPVDLGAEDSLCHRSDAVGIFFVLLFAAMAGGKKIAACGVGSFARRLGTRFRIRRRARKFRNRL